MKKIISIIVLLVIISFGCLNLKASSDLDRIDEYVITVDPRFDDGTLDIQIDLVWTVLDSSSEGPLEWIKIGVPNYHVSNLKPLTSNIGKISYYMDSGSFIRIDLDRSYYKGSTLEISFSFNQARMYHLYNDEVYYDYSPGYFNDIIVRKCILKWNKTNVKNVTDTSLDYEIKGDYYVWESRLDYGQTIGANLSYSKDSFNELSPKGQYTKAYMTPLRRVMTILIILSVVGFIVALIIIERSRRDPYQYDRGFIVYPRYHYFFPMRYYHNGVSKEGTRINVPTNTGSGSSGGHSGGGCACACACACAGGGRAGCSMKDFYQTNLKSEEVIKRLGD